MTTKQLLYALMPNFIDMEGCGIITIDEESVVSGYFPVADECDVESGEYFYTYLEDEQEMTDTEKFLTKHGLDQHFDYAFPLRDSDGWVGLVKIED